MTLDVLDRLRRPFGPFNGAADCVLLLLTVVYAATKRTGLPAPGSAPGANLWDHVVLLAYDPYLLLFLFLPWALAVAAHDAGWWSEDGIVLRCGSRLRWGYRLVRLGARRLLPIGVCWLVAMAVTSPGLPVQWGWSERATAPDSDLASVVALQLAPGPAVVLNLAFAAVTAIGLYVLVCCVGLSGRVSWVWGLAATLWFWSIWSFKRPSPVPPLNIVDGFQLQLAAADYGSRVLAGTAAVAPIVLAGVILALLDRRGVRRVRETLLRAAYPVVAVAAVAAVVAADGLGEWRSVLLFTFYGSDARGTELPRYLLHVIVFLGFAYLYAVRLDSELDGHLLLVAVRRGTLLSWWWRFSRPWYVVGAGVPAAAALVALLVSRLLPTQGSAADVPVPAGSILLYQMLVNGALQVWTYLTVVFLVRWLSGKAYAAAAGIAALAVLGLPVAQRLLVAPSALNSLGHALDGGAAVVMLTVRLTALLLVGTLVVGFFLNMRSRSIWERNFA